jgi:2-succinyl-5-enolpyruvyl-6-hydroxy-3-cyclohexene-1-carboxylate synthase
MKIPINLNSLWCSSFAKHISQFGVRDVCISPGSRSTPLTLAFSLNKKFRVYPIVDERSSGFFALGLAKKSNSPVVIVTTSGTAVAELYPAIIEAFYQRIPLIVCTADRPPYLRNRGANQTINQDNIYKNHIRFFADPGLPENKRDKFNALRKVTYQAVSTSLYKNRGPVHINFPFDKPFEPDTFTHSIDKKIIQKLNTLNIPKSANKLDISTAKQINKLATLIKRKRKGIIVCGYNNFEKDFVKNLINFSNRAGYPIFADGSSGLRYGKHSKENIIENFNSLIRSELFAKHFDPEVIIHFGGSATSNQMHDFMKGSSAEKILINQFGDINDPSLTANKVIKINHQDFCITVLSRLNNFHFDRNEWEGQIRNLNNLVNKTKSFFLTITKLNSEPGIIHNLIKVLPSNCNLMVSNSLPIRDIDFFSNCSGKEIKLFTNRGASGIDGINSTALGIAKNSKNPTVLLTGDLAFYHDLTGLHNSQKFSIPLTIVLINNEGGGIFESLPISGFGKIYKDNFVVSLKLDFSKIVKAFDGNYYIENESESFNVTLQKALKSKKLNVIEIKTSAKLSKQNRTKFWKTAIKEVDNYINANIC